ncbi:hypothetical protein PSEEN4657 [Pseudomonas entomophila L48]|uniref:Uncharacterized protein n=1 Tax=Pseudomonas entomophila (strain L48) TaxID=384676 RepID=Q1I4V8_PSEE4|nr:hypothetical protein PSEEN4657 [Pseudomonas entomophila L48]
MHFSALKPVYVSQFGEQSTTTQTSNLNIEYGDNIIKQA